jgi:hypothetical protein
MFGYPPFTRDQRIGTALTVFGTVLVFVTDQHLVYHQCETYLPPASGLLICVIGAYFNIRRRGKR